MRKMDEFYSLLRQNPQLAGVIGEPGTGRNPAMFSTICRVAAPEETRKTAIAARPAPEAMAKIVSLAKWAVANITTSRGWFARQVARASKKFSVQSFLQPQSNARSSAINAIDMTRQSISNDIA